MADTMNIKNLIINKVESQEVFEYMKSNNLINEDEIYLIEGNECAVLYTAQELTEEQKNQIRANIGMEDSDISAITTELMSTHNTALDAHEDIRELANAAQMTADEAKDAVNAIKKLPDITADNNGQFLRVIDGVWAAAVIENANGVSF